MRIRVDNVGVMYSDDEIDRVNISFNLLADGIEIRSGRIVLTEDEYKGNEAIANLESEVFKRLKGALSDGE